MKPSEADPTRNVLISLKFALFKKVNVKYVIKAAINATIVRSILPVPMIISIETDVIKTIIDEAITINFQKTFLIEKILEYIKITPIQESEDFIHINLILHVVSKKYRRNHCNTND